MMIKKYKMRKNHNKITIQTILLHKNNKKIKMKNKIKQFIMRKNLKITAIIRVNKIINQKKIIKLKY